MTTTATLERPITAKSRSLNDLKGYTVMAIDGEVGKVDDFYFDDKTWTLRYFVVDTGSWLEKRRVLVSPSAFTDADGTSKTIATKLSREQIEKAPTPDLTKPVSRQFEIMLHEHFAWPVYWMTAPKALKDPNGESHLRSFSELLNYRIQAKDGEIGHVEDLVVEESQWVVRLLAIDTRNWLPGRKVVVSPSWIDSIRWADKTVSFDLTREQIKGAPEYDPAQPVSRSFEEKLFDYYGRPRYWV